MPAAGARAWPPPMRISVDGHERHKPGPRSRRDRHSHRTCRSPGPRGWSARSRTSPSPRAGTRT
eukprot:3811181-Prymnesium_polylepis.1